MPADCHMHLAPDADPITDQVLTPGHIREYVATAVARGIDEITFTEHVYRFAAARDIFAHPFWQASCTADITAYRTALGDARESGLPVLAGLELDWIDGQEDALRAIGGAHDWDIVLGSVHWLGELAVDHPDYSIFDAFPADYVWREYAAAFCRAVASGLYDVMAHPDLPKAFGELPHPSVIESAHRDMVDALSESAAAIEVSTAGLRRAGELYPAPDLLTRCARAGIPVTIGSDAHTPDDVGRDFGTAVAALAALGIRSTLRFTGRQREVVPLA